MPATTLRVSITYAPEAHDDLAFAEALRRDLADTVNVQLLSVDDVATAAHRSRYEQAALLGTPVFILSHESTSSAERRSAFVKGNPILGHHDFRSYYVCRGITPHQLFERYPELLGLIDETMISSAEHKDSVVKDLRRYAYSSAAAPPTFGGVVRTITGIIRTVVAFLAGLLGTLGALFFLLGFPAGLALLVLAAADAAPGVSAALVVVCLIAFGQSLHLIESLEIWPWLGPRWKPNTSARTSENDRSAFSKSHLETALTAFRQSRKFAGGSAAIVTGIFLVPTVIAVTTTAAPKIPLLFTAILAGVILPLLRTWSYRVNSQFDVTRRGLLEETLSHADRHVNRLDVPRLSGALSGVDSGVLALFNESELTTIRRWSTASATGSNSAVHRPWFRPQSRVFISYAWADDPQIGLAEDLSQTLERLGIDYFLDRRHIPSQFVGWRSHVAYQLAAATHLLLIVSPNVGRARVVGREIRASLHRVYFELLPSIVAVVEPHTAIDLIRDPDVTLELRFLLACCPCMSPEESRDPDLLGSLIRQRRRNGRLRDWMVLLTGPIGERRLVQELFVA